MRERRDRIAFDCGLFNRQHPCKLALMRREDRPRAAPGERGGMISRGAKRRRVENQKHVIGKDGKQQRKQGVGGRFVGHRGSNDDCVIGR